VQSICVHARACILLREVPTAAITATLPFAIRTIIICRKTSVGGIWARCVSRISANKFVLVPNANARIPRTTKLLSVLIGQKVAKPGIHVTPTWLPLVRQIRPPIPIKIRVSLSRGGSITHTKYLRSERTQTSVQDWNWAKSRSYFVEG